MSSSRMVAFFFFQAEDGIRAHCVTGVQTCALPICRFLRAVPSVEALAVEQHQGVRRRALRGVIPRRHDRRLRPDDAVQKTLGDRKSTRLNSSHTVISYAVFCLKKKKKKNTNR